MYKYLIFYNTLLISYAQGSTVPAPKVSDTIYTDNKLPQTLVSLIKPAVSEGGAVPSNPIPLTNKNHTELLSSVNDLIMSKEKPVHGRKGVDYNSTEDLSQHEKVDLTSVAVQNKTIINTPVILPNLNTTKLSTSNSSEDLNTTKVHKPLILSHEALEKMDKLTKIDINEGGPDIVNTIKANSHPGMIMPIVITILVVPMFAVIGYLALKKGQEAWKNRHYKRMDFLLDGMYND